MYPSINTIADAKYTAYKKDYSYKCIFSTTSNVYYMVDQSGNVLVTDNGTPILLFQ